MTVRVPRATPIAAGALGFALVVGVALLAAPSSGAARPHPAVTGDSQIVLTIPGSPTPTSTNPNGGGGSAPSNPPGGGPSPTDPPGEPTAPPVPPRPTVGAESLVLDRDRIEAGETIVATGYGFTAGEQVQFVLYSEPRIVGSFAADPAGVVVARIEETGDLRLGAHTVEATGWSSQRIANARFVVVSPAGPGTSVFPWIAWVIVGGLLILALILYGIGAALGWLPAPAALRPTAVSS